MRKGAAVLHAVPPVVDRQAMRVQVHAFDPNYLKWDGTNDNTKQRVSDGVYTYVVYFKPSESPIEVHTGFVTIIR
jgi:hypothetical protein